MNEKYLKEGNKLFAEIVACQTRIGQIDTLIEDTNKRRDDLFLLQFGLNTLTIDIEKGVLILLVFKKEENKKLTELKKQFKEK